MGYYFRTTNSEVKFKNPVSDEVVNKLADFMGIKDPESSISISRWGKWKNMSNIEKVAALLDYDGWTFEDSYESIYFEYSKDSDSDEMWSMLAPYIERGSYIDCLGEDDCMWEYAFDGEKMEIRCSDDPFFPDDDEFGAVRANELLKKSIAVFKAGGFNEAQLAEIFSLTEEEKNILHNIFEKGDM